MRARRGESEYVPAIRRRGVLAACTVAGRLRQVHEIDRAFLRWFAGRLNTAGPEACEEVLVDYLIAEALSEPVQRSGNPFAF